MATITTQTIKVDLTPGRVYPVLHVSQGNVGLEALEFYIYQNGQPFTIPPEVTAINIDGMTPVGVFSYPCTWTGNVVTAGLTATMTAERGIDICELALYDATNNKIGTCNFVIAVEESPYTNARVSTSDMATIMAAASSAQQYELLAKSWAIGGTGIRTGEDANNSKYWAEQSEAWVDMAESWAVGGTGKRTGENTNNSKYYADQSRIEGNGLASVFSDVLDYAAGDYVIYNGILYQFKEDHAAGAWTGGDATALNLADSVVKLDYTLRGTPFIAERLWRVANTADMAFEDRNVQQCFCYVNNSFVFAGGLSSDTVQRFIERDLEGNELRRADLSSETIGHCNGICYDPDNNMLYVAGTARIVAINYADLTIAKTINPNLGTVTGVAYRDQTLYVYGAYHGQTVHVIGTVNLSTEEFTEIGPLLLNDGSVPEVVRQDMDVYDGYAYIVLNRTNQILKYDLEKARVDQSIIVGEGNGFYPYGEIESVTFINGQMYMVSALWLSNFTGTAGSIGQVFKTNIGGPVIVHSYIGQGMGEYNYITVDLNSTAKNPNGETASPFKTIPEACCFLMYQGKLSSSKHFYLLIANGVYTNQTLSLSGINCYVRGNGTGTTVGAINLTNGIYTIRAVSADTLTARACVLHCYSGSIATVTGKFAWCAFGDITVSSFDLEGCAVSFKNASDYAKATLTTSEMLGPSTITESLTSEAVTNDIKITKYGDVVTVYISGTITATAGANTTLATLPTGFRPSSERIYDSAYLIGSEWVKLRFYVRANGAIVIHNYASTDTLSGMYVSLVYNVK